MRFDAPDRWIIYDERTKQYRDERGNLFRNLEQVLLVTKDEPIFIPPELRPFNDPRFVTMHTWAAPAHSFELPVDLVTLGDEAAALIEVFSKHQHAMEARAFAIKRLPKDALPERADIIIAPEDTALHVLRRRARALLVIAFDSESAKLVHWPNVPTAMLRLPRELSTPSTIDEILFGIIHDQPLHRIVRTLNPPPELLANPWLDHALRMADAFVAAADASLDAEIASTDRKIFEAAIPEEGTVLDLKFDYVAENKGLLPTATRTVRRDMFEGAVPLTTDLDKQRRRVDARIERVDYVPPIDQGSVARDAIWVPRHRALRRGGRYRLRVQIGGRAEGNLIPDDTPDLVLPPTPEEYWTLDVVVFPKDFELQSPMRHTLVLPRAGASKPLRFDIIAPEKGEQAELRFGIYLGNQPLQSFLLTAKLAEEERETGDGLIVKLELAKSEGFGNLDSLGPRALSFGINLDADGEHTLCAKIGDALAQNRFPASILQKPLQEFRAALEAAAIRNGIPVFTNNAVLTPVQQAEFEKAVRQLARIGNNLYRALFVRLPPHVQDELKILHKHPEQPLNFPRFDPNLDMPWAILYDFIVPDGDAPVCRGGACRHEPGAGQFCLNGFWGIRHAIEEHLADGERRNSPAVVTPAAGARVLLASDAPANGSCAQMIAALNRVRAASAALTMPTDDALALLWDDRQRPAVMMYLGHYNTQQQIALAGTKAQLIEKDITDLASTKPRWMQPETIILLLACRAMQMTWTTLVDHALAFASAGASVIVGPQCTIFPDFACRFAEDVMRSMLHDRATLGAAMSAFRRNVITAGNPLGFAITAFGDADVTIQ